MSEKRREKAVRQVAAARAEILYERYKDALRRGHVAAMRGDIDEALTAYQEASRIAPSRPMARASAGLALTRAGRPAEALPHFDAAVRLAPHDEATRAGRAEALAALGRNADAAEDLDVVVDAREQAGRVTDALDAASRALGLAEARHRRRAVERLVAALGGSELDEPAQAALAAAMRVLDAGMAVDAGSAAAADAPAEEAPPAPEHVPEPGPAEPLAPSGDEAPLPEGDEGAEGDEAPVPLAGGDDEAPGPSSVPDDAAEPAADVPAPPAPVAAPSTRPAAEIAAEVAAAMDAGDARARDLLLELAGVHRAAHRIDAALDACYLGLSVAPDDVDLHLLLVALYGDRGWTGVATEKLDLLARLAGLDGDDAAAARVEAARAGTG